MVYVDTSVIVKLYIKEKYSMAASGWLKQNNESIPLTSFHELELINAIHLKKFRTEISLAETHLIMSRFEEHEKNGVYYRPPLNWPDIFINAIELSRKHTASIGSRALDILHVASALSIGSERFLTLDDRQTRLAALAGMKIENIRK